MSSKKKDSKGKPRAPIVLDDLLPRKDVTGGNGASIVFGVLSQEQTSTEETKKRRRKQP